MNIKDLLKPRVWLPAAIGILIGLVLIIIGENDDAPGLMLIGFISAIVLVFLGIYNAASTVQKGIIPSILCFLLGAFGVVWTITLAIEGEFDDSPGLIIFAILICTGLFIVGLQFIKKKK